MDDRLFETDDPVDGYVQKYRCSCAGGEWCWIVRYPAESISVSYLTAEEAEEELKRLRSVG